MYRARLLKVVDSQSEQSRRWHFLRQCLLVCGYTSPDFPGDLTAPACHHAMHEEGYSLICLARIRDRQHNGRQETGFIFTLVRPFVLKDSKSGTRTFYNTV